MSAPRGHHFLHVHLLVTGETEEEHLPELFSRLEETGVCRFAVERRVRQLSPRSEKRQLRMVGRRGHKITSRAEEEISFPARRCLRGHPDRILVLLDDLEHDRRDQVDYLYELYRGALDHLLDESEKSRAAVHFLVNMLEAYFFADPGALKRALGLDLEAHDGDVEGIRNPKSLLKKHFPGYSERDHGGKVLRELDLHQVLADPETCAWLRSCVSWTVHALGAGLDAPLHSSLDATTAACHLNDGHCQRLTLEQMLPSS